MPDIITSARITAQPKTLFDPMPQVWAIVNGEEVLLFEYYPDEFSFTTEEFIGLTVAEAIALKRRKNVDYLLNYLRS